MNSRLRRARTITPPPGFGVCCMCGAPCPDKFAGAARGWDWFTGYFDETVHFCPSCRGRHAGAHARLLQISVTPPVPVSRRHRLRDALKNAQ
ncbi:hypothetical protein P3T23_008439 [Paraburkholderia sp. GAS448]|uniref:hypothetical protein n=1 Tax=Paraburkholderia sp. GAS448 TaxID=3035136 RepID=UPI003D2175C0